MQAKGEADAATGPTGADRVLATLRLLGNHPQGVKLHDLAVELHSPKSSVHRALASLRRAELVEQDGEGRYRLGFGFLRIAFSYYDRLDQVDRIRPVLATLAEWSGETIHYGVLQGADVMYVAKVQPRMARIQMTSVVGGRNPAHCTGVGKVLLAYRLTTLEAVEEHVSTYGPFQRRTPYTLVEAGELHRDLVRTRQRGYGLDREESESGINCLAVPLFLTDRSEPEGAVSVSALAQRTPVEKLVAHVDELRDMIRDQLGDVTP